MKPYLVNIFETISWAFYKTKTTRILTAPNGNEKKLSPGVQKTSTLKY